VAVAEKNRERVIAIESERIEKDRQLEVVGREREIALANAAKDKEVEVEKRSVAEVVRERIAVDKTVAEQEENIKRLRAVEEAERGRQALVIRAEAQAQENLVKDIKAAEAAEAAAKFKAREELLLAETHQQAADLEAQAKIRLAEGIQAEAAAEGLADVQVRERGAEVIEKQGRAEAVVIREKALAGADALREKLKGEAEGLTEKAAALAAMDQASRTHEEFRLRLESERDIRMAGIEAQRDVAGAQASVLAKGLEKADIDIVGGDTVFFDKLMGSIALGKGVDGFIDNSEVAKKLAGPWLNGEANFADDVKQILASLGADDVKNLTVSAALMKLMSDGGLQATRVQELLGGAGITTVPVDVSDNAAAIAPKQ
jgi:hypothetical protein